MTQPTDLLDVFLDFETFYDRQYSLSKMPTLTYVRDPRFKFLGCSVAVDRGPITYYDNETEFREWLKTIDWSQVRMIAHNNLFDGTVLTERFGVRPAKYGCTLSMARPLLPLDSFALKNVAPLLGIGEKGDALVEGSTDGAALKDYANNDLRLSRGIYYTLRPYIPEDEMEVISLTVRMGVEPTFEADLPLLREVHEQFSSERTRLIADSGYTEAQLTSNQQFAQIIRDLGLNIPRKISATTEEETDALGKNDPEFQELMADYPQYGPIWEARLAAKSNINIKRTEKFIEIAELGGTLPMPYNYCGAGTTRWSGADKLNVQNLVRLDKSRMRNAFRAPKGYVVVAVDSSAIELRVNMWWSGQWDKVSVLSQPNPIIYELEAAAQLNKPVEEVTKQERQFGKVIQLGCIAEGSLVLTDKGLVPIEDLELDHRVWDGVEFVHHDGVIFKGYQEVITHDGLTATRDHRVWTEGCRDPIPFGDAASQMVRLQRTGRGGAPIRSLDSSEQSVRAEQRLPADTLPMRLWNRAIGFLGQLEIGEDAWLYLPIGWGRSLQPCVAEQSGGSVGCCATSLPGRERSGVSSLWRARDNLRVRHYSRSSELGDGQSRRAPTQVRDRSQGQRSWVRAWEPTLGVSEAAESEQNYQRAYSVSGAAGRCVGLAVAVCHRAYTSICAAGDDRGSDHRTSEISGARETKKLEGHTGEARRVRVFDIVNAGPRHRFTVSDVLVHNCGYGMGAPKFRHTCASGPMGMAPIYITEERSVQVIRNYRSNNPEVPASWRRMNDLIGQMYVGPKEPTTYRCIGVHKEALMLPNGLMLRYPGLHFDDAQDGWVYGVGKKQTRIYGGKLQENIVQGLARVIIGEQALRIDQRYRVLGLTHDEVIYIAPIEEAEEAVQFGIDVLSTSPSWAPDLPLAAEGEFAPYYNK